MKNLARWMERYTIELRKAVAERPDHYTWSWTEAPKVIERMKAAFEKGSYNKDTTAIKATCKHFGLSHTYKNINAFLRGNV